MSKIVVRTKRFWREYLELARKKKCTHTYVSVIAALEKLNCSKTSVEDNLALIRSNGGFCDCEAWFNAAQPLLGKAFDVVADETGRERRKILRGKPNVRR